MSMDIQTVQAWVEEDWARSSKSRPDKHLQLVYLFEELGEVMEAIRKSQGDKIRKDMNVDLEGELGDVVIALCTIANTYRVDLAQAIAVCQAKIIKRHNQGF